MIKKLKEIFPSMVIYTQDKNYINEDYQWFLTEDENIIGIPNHSIDEKELSLLEVFLTPYNIKFPQQTEEERKWKEMIKKPSEHNDFDGDYRFVYFSIQKHQVEPVYFKEAIQELFSKPIPILWRNEHEGIIIEELKKYEEPIQYDQIIDILMSDLYAKINFFVGPFQNQITYAHKYYQMITSGAREVFKHSSEEVITYIQAIPPLLIEQATDEFKEHIGKWVLRDTMNDQETLQMIKTLVACNLNISETAKELYMHRNSLQYRLDRFQEKTGLDIRNFDEAMTAYLAMIAIH